MVWISTLCSGGPATSQRSPRRSRSGKRRARPSRRSSSKAGPSPTRFGARPGATTWNRTATTKTVCRAAAPTSATARWWTCRFNQARSRPWSAARSFTRSPSTSRRCRPTSWRDIKSRCAGQIGSLVELLQGRLSKGVMDIVTAHGRRPVPEAERDQAIVFLPGLGGHVQARRRRLVRRGGASRSPARVALLLRKVDHLELIEEAAPTTRQESPLGQKTLVASEVAGVFGIELAEPEAAGAPDVASHSPGREREAEAARRAPFRDAAAPAAQSGQVNSARGSRPPCA